MKNKIKTMKGKKVLSVLLALVMVLSVASPAFSMLGITAGATSADASDAYATVITASDFQDGKSGNLHEETFSTLMQKAKANGVNEPDGFILGGDYEASYAEDHDTPTAYRRVESVITNAYPYLNRKNIVNIQGNHDINDPSVIDKTGPHEFDDYIVYVINNSDYPAGTGGTSAKNKTLETNEKLVAYFNKLKAEGETRPIFIATHIPLHHNSRNPKVNNKDAEGNVVSTGYNETLYGKILFDTINENAKIFDIVFLFGHNHSGDYDDYIGGSVNYIGKGETIRISDYEVTPSETSFTNETLNFTYMNYGYVGYSNNVVNNTLTMNTFEICPDKIVATRYSTSGQYGEPEIIDRNMKTDSPSVFVDAYTEATVGSATGVVAIASGFEDPSFIWSSSNEGVAKISGSDRVAKIAYNAAGTATIKVKVTDRNDSTKTAIYNYDVTVSAADGTAPGVAIYRAKEQVDNRTLEYYQINLGDTVALSGSYYGLTENATTAWSSSNTGVAKVNQYGLVTFVGAGEADITYTATDNGESYSATVKLIISSEKKFENKYVQTDTITAGKSYVIATVYNNSATTIYSDTTTTHDNVTALSGMGTAFKGSEGSYYLYLDDNSFVWDAVEATSDNQVYLQNADSGLYLAAYATGKNNSGSSTSLGYFELTTAKPSNGIWQFSGDTLQTTEGLKWYVRSNGICNITSGTGRTTILFEEVPLEAHVNIEFSGEVVNDTTKTVYLAVNGRQIELERDCRNIHQIQSEIWTSSNTDVATIDNHGVVTFKGVQGETVITYTATDAVNGTTVTASFTLSAMLTAEATRLFKYTETVVAGKQYIIANSISSGDYANAFSSFEVTYEKLLADRVEVTVEDGASYIEIPENLTEIVWTPEIAEGSSFYLKSDANGKYLYANTDGTYDSYNSLNSNVFTSDSYATNTEQYTWTYENGSKLYNQYAYTDANLGDQTKTYMRVRSAEFVGTSTESDSKVYFYEEIAAKPKAVITSRYEVLGETVERTEICPYQTETFLPAAEHFPDNTKVTFAWSSDNTSVATIDQNGKVTYTGKEGKVTITLTATSQVEDSTGAYPVATATVTIDVIGGVGYVDPTETVYIENAYYETDRLVPGRKYILHMNNSLDNNTDVVVSTAVNNQRIGIANIDAPQIDDANGLEYVLNTDSGNVWECLESTTTGYYYLRNVETGEYMYMSYYTDGDDTVSTTGEGRLAGATTSTNNHPGASSFENTQQAYNLIYSDGRLSSQAGDAARSNNGLAINKSSSGYYYTTFASSYLTVTLYEEPVIETGELPDGDVYQYTNTLETGKKYVIATGKTGTVNVMSTATYTENSLYKHPKTISAEVYTISDVPYIVNPNGAMIVECFESDVDGYFYLKDSDGRYLVVGGANTSTATNKTVEFTDSLSTYAAEAYTLRVRTASAGYTVLESRVSDLKYLNMYESSSGNNRFFANENYQEICVYSLVETTDEPEEDDTPIITEIRMQDDFGSVDITRTMQYRYDVEAGDTEQILKYIRGVAYGYTATWSVSNTSIATIDEDTGVLTYTGVTGYVDVMLTIEGEDFSGNDITRTIKTTFNISADAEKTRIAVPETVYMTPASGASTVGQIYVNNVMNANDFYNVETIAEREDDMYFGLRVVDAKSFTVSVSNVTDPLNDINLYTSAGSAVSETTEFNFTDGVFESDGQYSLRFSGAGLQPGEKATAKWDVTVTMNDGSTKHTYTLYTVMYAPQPTVGAVAEGRQTSRAYNEISSWITGANGVDHSLSAPLGSLKGDRKSGGTFKWDPLYNENPPTPDGETIGTSFSSTDYINPLVTESEATPDIHAFPGYVLQTATEEEDHSRSASYLGLLTVDKSRYSNTNQIPNLKIGYDVLNYLDDTEYGIWGIVYEYHSLETYDAYYTLGTEESFTPGETDYTATPDGWTSANVTKPSTKTSRESLVPSYNVSYDLDGKYIHALNQATCNQVWLSGGFGTITKYSTAGTSVKISVTDKAILRERVLSAYNVTDRSTELENALQNAAATLGNPAATQTEIDKTSRALYEAMAELADVYYTLKYDNLFSAFEYSQFANSMTVVEDRGTVSYLNGTITVVNEEIEPKYDDSGNVINGEAYTNYGSSDSYYQVDLKPNTEYVFEYYVTTTLNAQAFMFFYNSDGGNAEAPTNMSVKVNDGEWSARSESQSWWGNYTNSPGTYHYAIKFTTGATTVKAGFRFGNTSLSSVESTFSRIKLIDSAHYYEDAQYSKTESIHKEYNLYGSLITPERPGYSFTGWKDINGSTVTGANNAAEHLTIYSQWEEVQYNVIFNGNGGAGSTTSATLALNQSVVLPDDYTRDYHTFLGWSFDDAATDADFSTGQVITVSDVFDYIDSNNQVTLYAVWAADVCTVNYSNNGASDVNASQHNINEIKYTESLTLPTLTCDYAEFVGWSFDSSVNPYGNEGIYAGETNIKISDFPEDKFEEDGSGTPVIKLHAIWKLKASAVVDDIVVADFGQPVTISPYQMSDKGIVLYHAKDVCKGRTVNGKTVNFDIAFPEGTAGKYGTFALNADGYTINYTPTAVMQDVDTIKIRLTLYYDDTHSNTFDSTITVAPASNVLYEEDGFVTYGDGQTYKAWEKAGSSSYTAKLYDKNTGIYNDQDLIEDTPEEVHGYNSNYGGNYGFSDDSYSKVTVSANDSATPLKENMSDAATFTFKGTGFDLISACGTNTGIQLVKVKNASTDTLIKSYIVDTYLGNNDYLTNDSLLHQVPILAYRTETYGTYTVEVTAAYLSFAQALTGTAAMSYASAPVVAGNGVEISATTSSASSELLNELAEMGVDMGDNVELVWMDDNSVLNGGTGATDVATAVPKNGVLSGYAQQYFSSSVTSLDNYIDGFRVYNTLDGGDTIYDSETEQNNTYYNIVEEIGTTNSDKFEIIDSESVVNFNFSNGFDYDSFRSNGGAKGEIYLQPGQALAFKLTVSTDGTDSKVMLGMRAVNGSAIAGICTTDNINTPYSVTVNSATEMYYDISGAGVVKDGEITIAIQNTGDNILAVNNLKLVDGKLNSTGNGETPAGSNDIVGGSSSVPEAVLPVTPVTPNSEQNEAGNIGNAPETDVDTEASVPENDVETDVEDNTEEDADNSVTAMFPGMPVSIASFLELLFEFLGQLVGSLGF